MGKGRLSRVFDEVEFGLLGFLEVLGALEHLDGFLRRNHFIDEMIVLSDRSSKLVFLGIVLVLLLSHFYAYRL